MTLLEARLRLYGLSLRSYEKVVQKKKFLEIDFREGLFCEKLANSQISLTPSGACIYINH